MAGKQAKTLSTDHIDDLLFVAERSRHPLRNRLIVLLSVKDGLRAAEIAKLSWDMVLDRAERSAALSNIETRLPKNVAVGRSQYMQIFDRHLSWRGSFVMDRDQ
jgi:integrase